MTPGSFSLWSLPQPVFVLGSALLAASAITTQWMDSSLLISIILFMPFPLFLVLERLMPKREDWLLTWKDLLEDIFWVAATLFIWVPIYDENYDTYISDAFVALREAINFPYALEATSVSGLIFQALLVLMLAEFVGYWAHRLQHRYLFFWRIHAMHHHITKMSVGRTDRTHPLEFLGLSLGGAIALAFLGASGDVAAVFVVLRVTTVYLCHANLPLEPGIYGWFFNTPAWHQLHHSRNYQQSNTNFGCVIIFWDRLFGTFLGTDKVEAIGNGSGNQLSIATQLSIPFRSNKVLKEL